MPPVTAGFSLPNRQYHIKFFIFISLCGDRYRFYPFGWRGTASPESRTM